MVRLPHRAGHPPPAPGDGRPARRIGAMKTIIACLLLVAAPALAQQDPMARPQPPAKGSAACPECGVVTSVKTIEKKEPPPATDTTKPSGLVATVPLHGGKPKVGSSTRLGKDVAPVTHTYEVIVRLDNGRYQVFTLGDPGGFAQGDKVRVTDGRLVKRTD